MPSSYVSKVAARYLDRIQTDSVEDITFSLRPSERSYQILARHPRLKQVGYVNLEMVDLDTQTGLEEYEDGEFGSSIVQSRVDLEKWRNKLKNPQLQVWGVVNSWTDRRFRSEGLGVRLYLIALAVMARIPALIVPNRVFGGTLSTSKDADRVWVSLKRSLPHIGDLVWGGGLNLNHLLNTPLKPRRGRGFGPRRRYVYPFEE